MRAGILLALAVASTPLWFRPVQAAPEEKFTHFTGDVVALKAVFEKEGVKLDRALVVDGKSYPIIKDVSGRRFSKDDRLLNKKYQITGRLVGGTMLQVISVRSIKDGKLHDIYYWCDICAIRRSEMNDCECCGAPMELREELLGK
ncbi:MAG: hypothetical protein K8T89_11180 [Planctomycetes bacterium]|nr:hypothetical protein [Planctomycetota bacterium]